MSTHLHPSRDGHAARFGAPSRFLWFDLAVHRASQAARERRALRPEAHDLRRRAASQPALAKELRAAGALAWSHVDA